MKKLSQFISNAVLMIGVLVATLLLIPLISVVDQWYQLVIVQSASMEPKLPVGSLVVYRAEAAYYPGEIIVYQASDRDDKKLIVHRVVEKRDKDEPITYLAQGDATQYLSPQPIFAGQIKGKLIGSIPQLGYTLAWFKSKAGIATTIFIFLVLLIINEFIKLP